MKKKLTLKEQKFLDLLFTTAKGNASKAAHLAGYGSTMRSASTLAARLLAKVDIQRALVARQTREVKADILAADERDAILSSIARRDRAGEAAERNRISAIKELNKCTGRHSIKHIHDGKLTLEQVLGDSRK